MLTGLAVLVFAASSWERILLPVVTRGPVLGALGSSWETVVTVRNASDRTVIYYPTDWCFSPSGSVSRIRGPNCRRASRNASIWRRAARSFLNVTPELADQVFVQFCVHDLSRQAESFGTELPVIRASQMKTGAGQILDIPHDQLFRLTFRLYADFVERETELVVRFINETTGASSEQRFSVLPLPAGGPPDEALTTPPLYRQVSDFDATRIEIHPGDGDVRYWAFVSVTNNETQQITTLTVH